MTGHPSFLQLDRLVLGIDDPGTAAHLKACDECRAHVGRCEMPAPVPAATRELAMRSVRLIQLRRWLLGLPAAVVVAAFLALGVHRIPGRDATSSKGSPSVAVYVKHGAAVSLWDGRAPLFPGDGLQLKVAPAGFSRVTVASVAAASIDELYAGEVEARGETTLPRSWTLDADPGPEVMLIVFSRVPLSSSELRMVRDDLPRTRRLWSTRVEFWKRGVQR
jgi:hypothetical protein